jgi:DNA-directed RNA polymerase II subunit RPB1
MTNVTDLSFTKEIKAIQFGIYSPDEIVKMSVCEITNHKNPSLGNPNTLYDIRLGPLDPSTECPTCGLTSKNCIGHMSYIKLNVDVIHPLLYRAVLSFLKCFCHHCSKCLVTKQHLILWNINQKGESRFIKLLDKVTKIQYCYSCKSPQPRITFSSSDKTFYALYKLDNLKKIKLTTCDIRRIFDGIAEDDVRLLGFNPNHMMPKNLIISILPVIPPRSRPFVRAGSSVCDDDLTVSYSEIIKINNYIKDEQISEVKRNKYIQALTFRIKTLFDNSSGSARHTSSKPLKGIKERLSSKSGLIRQNLMGKRVLTKVGSL